MYDIQNKFQHVLPSNCALESINKGTMKHLDSLTSKQLMQFEAAIRKGVWQTAKKPLKANKQSAKEQAAALRGAQGVRVSKSGWDVFVRMVSGCSCCRRRFKCKRMSSGH